MAIKLVRCSICQYRHIIDVTELNELIANFSKKPVEGTENTPCDYVCADCSKTDEYSRDFAQEGILCVVLPEWTKMSN